MNNVARSSVLNAVAGLSTMMGGFISTVIVARVLGVEGSGIVAYAVWIVTTALIVVDLGIAGALSRYIPEVRSNGQTELISPLIRYFFVRHLAAVSTALLLVCVYALWLSAKAPHASDSLIDRPAFWVTVALATLVQGFAALNGGILRGVENFRRFAIVSVSGSILQIAAAYLGSLWFGPLGAMWSAILGYIIAAVSLLSYISRSGTLIPSLRSRANSFAFETWAGYLVTAFAWSRMEIFFLERSWGAHAAGFFGVGLTLANMAVQAPILLAGPLTPYIVRHAGKEHIGKANEAYGVGLRILAFIVFPACLSIAAVAPELLPLIFGRDFEPAVPVSMVLMVGAGASAIASVAQIYLYAMERPRVITLVGGFAAVATVLVGLLLVPVYGPLAAAFGRSGTQIAAGAILMLYIRSSLRCPTSSMRLAACLIASLCAASAAFVICAELKGLIGVALGLSVAVLIYVLVVFLLRPLQERDVQFISATVETLVPAVARPLLMPALDLYRRRLTAS